MTLIEWSDNLKVGIPAMDAEHRRLVALTNDFLVAAREGTEPARLDKILAELIEQTRRHFIEEETLMDRVSYPHLAAHRVEHERLLTEARLLLERFVALDRGTADFSALTLETARYLQRWLVDHIVADDKPYRPYLAQLG